MASLPLRHPHGTAGKQRLRLCGVEVLVPLCHSIHGVTLGKCPRLPPSTSVDTESAWYPTNASDDYYPAPWLAERVPVIVC